MSNTYRLKNGENVIIQAWDVEDFIRSEEGKTSRLIREGVSKWKTQDGTWINVNDEDVEEFLQGRGMGARLFHGNKTVDDIYYTAQTGIAKQNESIWDDPLGWWQITKEESPDPEIMKKYGLTHTPETNTWIEDWFSPGEGTSNQLTDWLGDTYRAAVSGWTSASYLTELSNLYDASDGSMTPEQEKEAFEAMEALSKIPVSTEMIEFQRHVNRSDKKGWEWVRSLSEASYIENPSLATEVLVSSVTGLIRAAGEKEGLNWAWKGGLIGASTGAAIGAGVGAAATAWSGPGAGVGAAVGAKKGAIRGFIGGVIGGVSGALEAGTKMGELLRE